MIAKYKTDNNYILKQYKTDKNLSKRQQIYKYSTNQYNWLNWVFDKINIKNNIKILEIGCGNGILWIKNIKKIPNNIEIVLSDISEGMINEVKNKINNKNFIFKIFDANSIPFEDKYFDIIIANHMLYHVKDINKTLLEIKRTLKNNGLLIASTNGKNHLIELKKLVDKFLLNIDFNPNKLSKNFQLENGKKYLKKYFSNIQILKYIDELKVPEIQSIINYLDSARKINDKETDYLKLKNYLEKKIKKKNFIKIKRNTGLFIAKKMAADFI